MTTLLSLSFLAGMLTCLSPCVFPVVPLIVGSSLQRNRLGPLVLAIGLVISFTTVGVIFLATGTVFGIGSAHLRVIAGVLLIVTGVFLLSKRLQGALSGFLSPVAAKADRGMRFADRAGLIGQFFTGSLLGVLWSPCTGPTMGATLALGAKNGPTFQVVTSMLLFGIGAATPILAVAYGARNIFSRQSGYLLQNAQWGKVAFGVIVIFVGVSTLIGLDKAFETLALDILPDWLTEFTVSI